MVAKMESNVAMTDRIVTGMTERWPAPGRTVPIVGEQLKNGKVSGR